MAQARTAQVGKSRSTDKARSWSALAVLALLSMLGCAAAAAWMHWDVAPRVVQAGNVLRAEIMRTQSVADALVSNGIAHGLAGGDYGEVQETLAQHQSAGYLTRAAVINASGKIVAVVGSLEGLQIGEAAPSGLLAAGRPINLSLGSQSLGQLLILAAPPATADSLNKEVAGLRVASILVAALAVLSAGAVVWLRRESRRDIETARRSASRARAESAVAELPAFSERSLQDLGPSTMQDIESELRKRVAESRLRRAAPTGDTSQTALSAALADQGLQELGQSTMQDIEPELRERVAASRLRRASAEESSSPATLPAARADQGLRDLGDSTMQDIEFGVRNRVAESRMRRATAAAEASSKEGLM